MKVVCRYLLYSFYYRRQRNLLKTVTRSLILLICSCVISNQLFQNKKTISLVSRILFLNHHLSSCAITNTILLPTLEPFQEIGIKRAAFKDSYTWHYNTQGLPSFAVTNKSCELLPHIFTCVRFLQNGSYFLWHYLSFICYHTNGRRLTGGLPYAVRTFLSA